MESIITLDEAKIYMKITDNSEDQLIQTIIYAVEIFVRALISPQNAVNMEKNIPSDLRIAMLDHIAFMYENRGNLEASIPMRIIYIYKKYKNIRLF